MPELTDEEYYRLPPLFHLDDRERCLSQPAGAFCLGSFELLANHNHELFHMIQEYSANTNNFNYTRLHRGLCVSTKCGLPDGSLSLEERFVQCVQNWTNDTHGLGARLANLDYCETKDRSPDRSIDTADITFACLVGLLLLLNIVGTVYDLTKQKTERNRYLAAWSLVSNCKQWTSRRERGHPLMSTLGPLHAIKALAMGVVVSLHTPLMYHRIYLQNPLFLEKANRNPLSMYLFNSSMVVQAFFMVTSFLIVYKQLLAVEDGRSSDVIRWTTIANNYVKRIIRMSPVNVLVVGLSATWLVHASSGPLWAPLVGYEDKSCRSTWWTHLIFINNLVYPQEVCHLQSWYIAADMQLYLLVIPLSLLLPRHSRRVIGFIVSLCVISTVFNFFLAYLWNFRPLLFLMKPELQSVLFGGGPSLQWMYKSPWGNMFSSLIGILLAFLHRQMQKKKIKFEDHNWLIWAFRGALFLIAVWMLAGYWALQLTNELVLAFYTTLERPVFTLLSAITLIGFLNKCDYLMWKFLWWRCWQILSRMQLSVFMVHWAIILIRVAQWGSLIELSCLDTLCDAIVSLVLTYAAAVVVYLLVEAPAQDFFNLLMTSPTPPAVRPASPLV